jgi:hypothetical protein
LSQGTWVGGDANFIDLSFSHAQFVTLTDTGLQLIDEVTAWEAARNKHHAKVDWQFTTAGARIKLERLYPSM